MLWLHYGQLTTNLPLAEKNLISNEFLVVLVYDDDDENDND
jgi:hypothetical protein